MVTTRRNALKLGLAAASSAVLPFAFAHSAAAQTLDALQIFVPAAPGGGWDQTARTIELAMRTDAVAKDFKFEHAPGAGGAVGLPDRKSVV